MSTTSTENTVTSKLSNSLKERLKRCGRYHASPEPVARQPKLHVAKEPKSPEKEQTQLVDICDTPSAKRQCLSRQNDEIKMCESPSITSDLDLNLAVDENHEGQYLPNTSISTSKTSIETDANKTSRKENQGDLCNAEKTPLSQRSRSYGVKGSRLKFDNVSDSKENNDKLLNKDSVKVNCANVHTGPARDNAMRNDLDLLHDSMSRSDLVKELASKEDQLRKLKMVRMYRSKNNLEELQTLIDKWRDISQQALQDLHSAMPEPKPTLTELINHLGIENDIIHFSAEDDETFY